MREIIIGAINHPEFEMPVPAMNYDGRLQVIDKNHPNAILLRKAPEIYEALKDHYNELRKHPEILDNKLYKQYQKIEALINEIENESQTTHFKTPSPL